jgi:hypothetical protein
MFQFRKPNSPNPAMVKAGEELAANVARMKAFRPDVVVSHFPAFGIMD